MSGRPVGSIGLPECSAGHLDHFDVIGLETFVDRADTSHARRPDGGASGGLCGAGEYDEQCHQQPGPTCGTDPVDIAHAFLRVLPPTAPCVLPEHLHILSDLTGRRMVTGAGSFNDCHIATSPNGRPTTLHIALNTCVTSELVLLLGGASDAPKSMGGSNMTWKAPKIVEVPVGMEINMYACAARK
ncbi:coenzyme PQQ synthesis protein A [mine drainage metagenome]|uniref:Coenzyme PQQ synthesis protein A n=1 Tax=mine drainage metagenome TaxID=410659 RepID=A0A1J5P4G1_9ZZZZ